MEETSTPATIAIKVNSMGISDEPEIKTASSYIPRSHMPAPDVTNTDWMSSSCGEKPFLNDDIRDWRHFRLRVRKGNVNDHLESDPDGSPDSGHSSDNTTPSAFGDFYFEGEKTRGRSTTDVNALSSSVPIRSTPKFEVGSCPAVVINLPSLTPVSNTGSELMKKNLSSPRKQEQAQRANSQQAAAQSAAQSAANNSADDSIFDLEM